MVPILKKGTDSSIVTNNRPISLLSTLLKSVEGLIKIRFDSHILENMLLPGRSYALRKPGSTAQCINDLINTILDVKFRNMHVVAACLDLYRKHLIVCSLTGWSTSSRFQISIHMSFLGSRAGKTD